MWWEVLGELAGQQLGTLGSKASVEVVTAELQGICGGRIGDCVPCSEGRDKWFKVSWIGAMRLEGILISLCWWRERHCLLDEGVNDGGVRVNGPFFAGALPGLLNSSAKLICDRRWHRGNSAVYAMAEDRMPLTAKVTARLKKRKGAADCGGGT
jgi:hypothetical protein